MKKLIVIFTVVLSAAVIAFVGCQKTSTEKQEQGIVGTTEVSANLLGMSVNSSYGFLVFTTTDDVDAYLDYLKANTHADVQEYLSSIGFSNSLGATLYDEEYATELVTEEQAINYIVNTHRIFQVQDVIMKPINEVNEEVKWEFLLTMVSSNLNNSSYENLIANYYDENTMNKFATNWQDSTFDLLEFIDATPNGYEETEPNSTQAARPMFGSVTTCTDTPGGCFNINTGGYDPCCYINTKKYFFWIKVSDGKGHDDGPNYGSCANNGF